MIVQNASLNLLSLAMIDGKNNKVADTNYVDPTPVVVVTVSFFPSSNQRFCNVYSQAAHLGSGFSGGEIHDLRRLRREGSPGAS